uniref:Uncharacterized protein n=1 Tax=Macrostomum lignano TaxID=282301 RepID=A0A1I8FBX2_9PLAT
MTWFEFSPSAPSGRTASFLLQRGSLPQASAAGAAHLSGLQRRTAAGLASLATQRLPLSASGTPASCHRPRAAHLWRSNLEFLSARAAPLVPAGHGQLQPYPPPASSAASSGSTAGTVPRFRSRTPGPETSLSGSAFDDQQQQQQQPARPRTPTGLVEGRGYHQQQAGAAASSAASVSLSGHGRLRFAGPAAPGCSGCRGS